VTPQDLVHLRRCIDLAREARDRGDEPFGSVLVGGDGTVLAERTNRVNTDRDATSHPEHWLAAWAAHHLTPAARAAATLYTSGESCAMCSAAQYWAGVGRLVFVMSGEQLAATRGPGGPGLALSSREVFARGNNPDLVVEGPVGELVDDVLALFA
jgi:tRNA(Arg) A34 adenosine deaminase TadA